MSEESERIDEPILESKLAPLWGRLAPLSIGAVASSALIVLAGGALKRVLGPRRNLLSWTSALALIPVGVWLLSRDEPADEVEPGVGEAATRSIEEKTTEQMR